MQVLTNEHLTWINIERPTEGDIARLGQEYEIHPFVLGELSRHTFRSKVDDYGSFLYLVLHFPFFDHLDSCSSMEIDFIIGKSFLITVQYKKNPELASFIRKCLKGESVGYEKPDRTSGHLLYAILMHLFALVIRDLDKIERNISNLEHKIFKEGKNDEVLHSISIVQQKILDFRRAIRPQEHIFSSLLDQGKVFFGHEMVPHLGALGGEHLKIWNYLETHKETIEALQNTNASIISTRTSEITKNLTIIAFLTFPLTLFANLFSMNTSITPIVGKANDFWIIIGIMFASTFCMFIFFKYKKWI